MGKWSEKLRLLKAKNERVENDESWHGMFFETLCDYLNQHVDRFTNRHDSSLDETTATKESNIETQCALRCASIVVLQSVARTDEGSSRSCSAVQDLAVVTFALHLTLIRIISHKDGTDRKSIVLAARLLCNLITGNSTTASSVWKSLALSPSPDQVSVRIMSGVGVADMSIDSNQRTEAQTLPMLSFNWVDMMLVCSHSGNRSALAAVVALLHNCIAVLDDNDITVSVAKDPILISTVSRQMLPVSSVRNDSCQSTADEATEWISLFLERLAAFGLLPKLYVAVGRSSIVTPEHLVLLHCISARVDEWFESSHNTTTLVHHHPLGNTEERLIETHLFLASLTSQTRHSFTICDDSIMGVESSSGPCLGTTEVLDADSRLLAESAYIVILEIMATSMGYDGEEFMSSVRRKVGTETRLLVESSWDLGRMVDTILLPSSTTTTTSSTSSSSSGGSDAVNVKSRELKLPNEEQRTMTTLVRLLGNACYQCRSNQDALRNIIIPIPIPNREPLTIPKDARHEQQQHDIERTALHVLLSCTSLAHGCFTLREWTVVAVRNALEDNVENQALVEQLEAQQPLRSPEMEQMGIQVDLDQRGNVKIVHKEVV